MLGTIDFYTSMFEQYSKMDWVKVREVAMSFEPIIRRKWPDYLEEMNGSSYYAAGYKSAGTDLEQVSLRALECRFQI